MHNHIIGIDIAKDHLDVHRLQDNEALRVPNSIEGCQQLIRWMGPRRRVQCIAFEATGAYHRTVERVLGQAGYPIAKINARRARDFAKAAGMNAKTDRQDALLLARFAQVMQPEIRPAKPENQLEYQELESERLRLTKERTALLTVAKTLEVDFVKTLNASRLSFVEKQIKTLDKELAKRMAASAELSRKLEILRSIPGLGPISSRSLLIEMPELGAVTKKQAASLAGLAPFQRESGTFKGKAKISGGRSGLRKALYMPALSAKRFNPDISRACDRILAKGAPQKVAIAAAMRRLIVLANTLIRDDRKWTVEAP